MLKSARDAFESKKEEERNGGNPLYRQREWRRCERRRQREKKKNEWFRKSNKESVMFIPATPESELRKKLQEEVGQKGFKIKVVEKLDFCRATTHSRQKAVEMLNGAW